MAMAEVFDDMFSYANTYIKNKSVYAPKILPQVPQETNTFPVIAIMQSNDVLVDEDLTKGDQQYRIDVEIEIYAIDKGTVAKQKIIKELKGLVNEVFDDHFGMYRRACIPTPNADRNIDKLYMRYNAIIDKNKIIYRR